MNSFWKGLLPACAVVAVMAGAGPARADLVLNATGIADGFSVTNFATGLPSLASFGPFGLSVVNNGSGGNNVLVNDYASSTLYTFNDSDGQTPASALNTRFSNSGTAGYASLNGVGYGSQNSQFGTFSSTGTFTPFAIAGLPGPSFGMAGDKATGEIIASSGSGLIAINPTTNTFRTIRSGLSLDGVSISPDGQIAYVENGSFIQGYNVHTGALTFSIAVLSGHPGPDGTGVISSTNKLNGDIIVNANNGDVFLIDPVADTVTLIGTNANERGDYTAPDASNGTLLMDFTDQIERLSCGADCGIGSSPPPAVPEPASLALFGVGLVGFGMLRKRWNKV